MYINVSNGTVHVSIQWYKSHVLGLITSEDSILDYIAYDSNPGLI